MNREVAVRTDEGSEAAQSALAALAYTLNINENTFKIALNGAFDMMQVANGNPTLALQLSFSRMDYRIDHGQLFEIIGAFRQAFGGVLGLENSECYDKMVEIVANRPYRSSSDSACTHDTILRPRLDVLWPDRSTSS